MIMAMKSISKLSRVCHLCSIRTLSKLTASEQAMSSSQPTSVKNNIAHYDHVSKFPMPLPDFEKMDYDVSQEDFTFVLDYLPKALKPISPSTVTEHPSGWVPGKLFLFPKG